MVWLFAISTPLSDGEETVLGAAAAVCLALNQRRRSALLTTNTELKLIASAPSIGFILSWKAG